MAKCPIRSDKFLIDLARRVRHEVIIIAYGECCRWDDLSEYCAIASHFLVSIAKRYGYKLNLIEGVAFEPCDYDFDIDTNHCWVQYKGKIIDLTATQFGVKTKIHVVDDTNKNYHTVKRNQAVIKSMKNDWPREQTPYSNSNKRSLAKASEKIIEALEKIA